MPSKQMEQQVQKQGGKTTWHIQGTRRCDCGRGSQTGFVSKIFHSISGQVVTVVMGLITQRWRDSHNQTARTGDAATKRLKE